MQFSDLQKYAREQVAKYPKLKPSFANILADVRDEIADESSETHECEMAYDDMRSEVAELEKKK